MTTVSSPAIKSMLRQFTVATSTMPPAPTGSLFLSLPLEVRLQIYRYILESHPAKHAHLSPSSKSPPPTSSAFFLRAIAIPVASQSSEDMDMAKANPEPFPSTSPATPPLTLLPVLRGIGCGCIPNTLLRTCKQVYEEARMIPWEENEYVFINWFGSGVYAARSFLRALKPWQRESMRWARMEVLRRDLENTWAASMIDGCPGTGEWKDLCGLWSGNIETGRGGLWGLRLGIKGCICANAGAEAIDGSDGVRAAVSEIASEGGTINRYQNREKGLLNVEAQWVTQGLAQMRALEWLEIDNEISRDAKVDFCMSLGQKLSDILRRRVEVLLAEKLVEGAKARNEETTWAQPEDNYIWALDS